MIFKFDKGGNMNMEGDNEMAKKKDRFAQMDIGLVNAVKEEVMGMVNETQSQVAVGFNEILDENDKVWDKGSKDGEVESEKVMPPFGSLSSLSGQVKEETDFSGEDETEEERNEAQRKKDELKIKREQNKLKKEMKSRLEKLNNSEEWKFDNVIEVFRNNELVKYQGVANIEVLSALFERGVLSYNGELQRGYRKGKNGDLLAVRSKKQIDLIYSSIIKNKMHGGFITFNWNPEKGDINYDEDERTLSGSIDQKLDILDGQHRLSAFLKVLKAYRKSPETIPNPADYQIGIVIELLDDDSAKSLFSEYATKGLKISRSRGEYLNVEDYTNKLCRDVMKKSDLKVEVVSTSIKATSENIITFGVLSKNIKDNYNPKTKIDVEECSKHLIAFVDAIIQNFPKFMASKDLIERKILRENSLTMEALAWSGYFYISKSLQGKSKEEMLSILSKFNSKVNYRGFIGNFLDKENPIFRKIMREGNKMISTSSSVTWVNKVFNEYILEGKSLEEIGREEVK